VLQLGYNAASDVVDMTPLAGRAIIRRRCAGIGPQLSRSNRWNEYQPDHLRYNLDHQLIATAAPDGAEVVVSYDTAGRSSRELATYSHTDRGAAVGSAWTGSDDTDRAGTPRAMMTPTNIERRLLFILHRGFVEARLLAQAGKTQQVHDLADALEPLPGWIASWKDEYLEATRANLETYAAKYPDAFEYLVFIDKHDPPATF
jgi:YD repeat-containing protein